MIGWIITYLVLYSGMLLYSLWDNIGRKEPLWYVVVDVLADASAILFIAAYWLIPSSGDYGPVWPALFAFSLGWIILTAPYEIRKGGVDAMWADEEARGGLIFGFVVVALLCAPAYIWGGLLSWNYLQSAL